MTVGELRAELALYDDNLEVRVVDRAAGWNDSIYMLLPDTYGIDSEKQMAICLN